MSIAASMLPEFDHEMAITRKYLERVPEAKFAYKPHDKSMTLGQLASHLVEMVSWTEATAKEDSFNIAPDYKPYIAATNAELLAKFDADVATARAAIAAVPDAAMMTPWRLLMDGKEVFQMPRVACLRGMCFNHCVHHRGQLSVYLRLNEIPVPATYGPSADEQTMG